jgi:hypothetical protein
LSLSFTTLTVAVAVAFADALAVAPPLVAEAFDEALEVALAV